MAQTQPNKNASLTILIIEDSEDDALLMAGCFTRAGYAIEFQRVENAAATRQAMSTGGGLGRHPLGPQHARLQRAGCVGVDAGIASRFAFHHRLRSH